VVTVPERPRPWDLAYTSPPPTVVPTRRRYSAAPVPALQVKVALGPPGRVLPGAGLVRAALSSKVAVTLRGAVMVTVQVPVPGQLIALPLQPVKVEPFVAAAVRVTLVP
jgi:hypothetical protein